MKNKKPKRVSKWKTGRPKSEFNWYWVKKMFAPQFFSQDKWADGNESPVWTFYKKTDKWQPIKRPKD